MWTDQEGKIVDTIGVYFDHKALPKDLKYHGDTLRCNLLFRIIQDEWNFCDIEHGEYVPKFEMELHEPEKAQIRVTFKGKLLPDYSIEKTLTMHVLKGASYTEPITSVKSWDPTSREPTMVLGFYKQQISDGEIYHTLLHEFGHALGLYHEHQNEKYLKIMTEKYYKSEDELRGLVNNNTMSPEDFRNQYWFLTDYDQDFMKREYDYKSIMHYK